MDTYPSYNGAVFKVVNLRPRNATVANQLLICITASAPCNSLNTFIRSQVRDITYSFSEAPAHRCVCELLAHSVEVAAAPCSCN